MCGPCCCLCASWLPRATPVRALSCSPDTVLLGPLPTALCPPMLCTQQADSLKLHIPASRASGFQRAHTQEDTVKSPRSRERKKTGNFTPISSPFQWLGLLRGACSCQIASLRFQFTSRIWILPPSLSLRFLAVVKLWVTSYSSVFHSFNISATISLY